MRPALVTTGEPVYRILLGGHYIPKEELAAAMVDLAINGDGGEKKQFWSNEELKGKGKAALTSKK